MTWPFEHQVVFKIWKDLLDSISLSIFVLIFIEQIQQIQITIWLWDEHARLRFPLLLFLSDSFAIIDHISCICLTFSSVRFQMSSQIACPRGCIFTLVAFVWLFSTVNETSMRMDQSTHSHTGCICWTFLRCVFLNVSSNGLPERMHSHIGCICFTFLHCAFSNVSSNCLL